MKYLLLLLLFVQDDLVEKLGDSDSEVRSDAHAKILDMGEKALPALRKAKDDENLTRRTHVRDLLVTLEWGLHKEKMEITAREKKVLIQQNLLSGLEWKKPAGWKAEEADFPWDKIWEFIRKDAFKDAKVAKGWKKVPFLMRTKDRSLFARIGPKQIGDIMNGIRGKSYPRLYLLRGDFDLSDEKIKWSVKNGSLPCLSDVWNGKHTDIYQIGPWTKRFQEKGKTTGVLHSFNWDQDKPFPNLRHIFVKKDFALLVIDYQ